MLAVEARHGKAKALSGRTEDGDGVWATVEEVENDVGHGVRRLAVLRRSHSRYATRVPAVQPGLAMRIKERQRSGREVVVFILSWFSVAGGAKHRVVSGLSASDGRSAAMADAEAGGARGLGGFLGCSLKGAHGTQIGTGHKSGTNRHKSGTHRARIGSRETHKQKDIGFSGIGETASGKQQRERPKFRARIGLKQCRGGAAESIHDIPPLR